jgi:hypothetical protein
VNGIHVDNQVADDRHVSERFDLDQIAAPPRRRLLQGRILNAYSGNRRPSSFR